jgi:predicted transcriptional regulator
VWTEETTAICFGMKRAGMTNRQIAERLGVTEREVKRKCLHKVKKRINGLGGPSRLNGRILAGATGTVDMEDL